MTDQQKSFIEYWEGIDAAMLKFFGIDTSDAGWTSALSPALRRNVRHLKISPDGTAKNTTSPISTTGKPFSVSPPPEPGQSNGKLERWHKSLKSECIRPLTPLTLEDARSLIQTYVDRYNTVRLHSAIGYVTPQDMLAGRQAASGGRNFARRHATSGAHS